jgi:hypothetical protein
LISVTSDAGRTHHYSARQLASEQGLKTTQNVAAGVAGIFIPVLWFGVDFQGIPPPSTAFQHRFISQSLMRLVAL